MLVDVGFEESFGPIVGSSHRMRHLFRILNDIAPTELSMLVNGETGCGKELVARAIHRQGPWRAGPFVPVNVAAVPEALLESEFFGHEKGAFTGASVTKLGRFELADGGTIFLDEIGELSPTLQVKLLRVLQEQSFERVGDERTVEVNVRVIAATNRDLRRAIENGSFREDLFYRLCVVPIRKKLSRHRAGQGARIRRRRTSLEE